MVPLLHLAPQQPCPPRHRPHSEPQRCLPRPPLHSCRRHSLAPASPRTPPAAARQPAGHCARKRCPRQGLRRRCTRRGKHLAPAAWAVRVWGGVAWPAWTGTAGTCGPQRGRAPSGGTWQSSTQGTHKRLPHAHTAPHLPRGATHVDGGSCRPRMGCGLAVVGGSTRLATASPACSGPSMMTSARESVMVGAGGGGVGAEVAGAHRPLRGGEGGKHGVSAGSAHKHAAQPPERCNQHARLLGWAPLSARRGAAGQRRVQAPPSPSPQHPGPRHQRLFALQHLAAAAHAAPHGRAAAGC